MNQYKHLLALDLTSYGAAFSLVNQFVDGENIRAFELSPCGTTAQLMLLSKELLPMQLVNKECQSFFKSQILDSQLIENIHENLLNIYLGQNKPSMGNSLLVLEGGSTAEGLRLLQALLLEQATVIDFRILRTSPKSVVITATHLEAGKLQKFEAFNFKKTFIEKVEKSLRSYFEI